MDLWTSNCFFWFLLLTGFIIGVAFCDQDGFLSLLCGEAEGYVDSSNNISWIPDAAYINVGNVTTVDYLEVGSSSSSGGGGRRRLTVRFFPDSLKRKCYKLPLNNNSNNNVSSSSSLVLVRTQFVYKNYDGLNKPPSFSVSLGRAIATTVNLSNMDPWIEEFIWPVDKDIILLCFHSIFGGGFPVISTIELRPIPQGAYSIITLANFSSKLLRKSYRINSGYIDGSLRYPLDQYDRIWDPDKDYSPFHVSAGFNLQSSFHWSNLTENPPMAVLQTARVLAKWAHLTYSLPLDDTSPGDYHVMLYFAGILPVSPAFDILINGGLVESNYVVNRGEVNGLFFTMRGIKSLNLTLKTINYYPLINALEVYQILDIPPETSSTTVSALQVIQQSTGWDLGWEDDPCSPRTCAGNFPA